MNFSFQKKDSFLGGAASMFRQLKPLRIAFPFGKFSLNDQRQPN